MAGDVHHDLEQADAGVDEGDVAEVLGRLHQQPEQIASGQVGGDGVAFDDDGGGGVGPRHRRRLLRGQVAQDPVGTDDLGGTGVVAVQVGVGGPELRPVRDAQLLARGRHVDAEQRAGGGDIHRRERSVGLVQIIGVDIGGTGIKGAPVDTTTGELTGERVRILTPQPATPEAVADVVAEVVANFPDVGGPIGCAFPAVVKRGVTLSAANVDKRWIGLDADGLFTERLEREVHMVNDADAAGLAEVRLGVARGREGVVLLVTLGTGIGTALFVDGVLVPNTELGHIELRGMDAEDYASERARIEADISWKKYAARLDEFLAAMEALVNPDLIVLGGGGSKKADRFVPLLERTCEVVPAEMRNEAGIVGAALIGAGPELAA